MRPLLLADLRTILAGLDYQSWPTGVAAARDTFALLAGFAGALRRSELAALRIADTTWHPNDGLYLRIRASKTDQDGHGATVVLPFGSHPGTCPPCAWLRWARLLDAHRHGRLELMRTVFTARPWPEWTHLCGAPTPTPAAAAAAATGPTQISSDPGAPVDDPADSSVGADGGLGADAVALAAGLPGDTPLLCAIGKGGTLADTPITGDGLHVMVKRRAQTAGIPGPIGFHSLRAGFVTEARRAGADTRAVRRQTRHSSDAMVEIYDRDHAPLLGNAVLHLGL
jgi:hypothetical protein